MKALKPIKIMGRLAALVTVFCAFATPTVRAGFVYESPTEFLSSGDFNGDGILDVLVFDKVTGNARVGYSDGNGGLTWSSPFISGVENATGLGVEHFLQKTNDSIAVTSPGFNQVSLLDVSHTNAGSPQTFVPNGIGPHSLVGLRAPRGSISPGLPFLLVASSYNDSSAELLDLLQWSGSPLDYGTFNETGSFDRPNALDIDSNTPTLAAGLVRGGTNDSLDLWEFDNTPGVVGTFSNLPPGGDYAFGNFNNEALPRFIFYQHGGSNLTIVSLSRTNGAYSFGGSINVPVSEAIQGVFIVATGAGGSVIIQFGDGVQGLTLPGGSPTLSAKYQTGAGAAGNTFVGVVPLTNGMFALLDAPPGGSTSTHAQVIQFDGVHFTQRSTSSLPSISSRTTRANVWLFQMEPFVNRSPGFIASLNSPDWADGVTGLPGAVKVPTEADSGATNGLGGVSTNNLGAAPTGSAYGIANQYNPAISLFSYTPPRAAAPISVVISPPPGPHGSPLAITFSVAPASAGVRYRAGATDSWHAYAAQFFITNDTTIQYYGTNSSGARSALQFASYTFGIPTNGGVGTPLIIDPTNTNTPPVVSTNQLTISEDGTVFYGRRSAANVGTIWAINLDGSGDTYITTGARPRASADGRWLAFLREGNPFNSQGNVWVRDLQSGVEQRIFANNNSIASFEWETNDTALLMDYSCGIWDLNTNGSLSALISGDCFDDAPTRNPVDDRIAFHNLNPNTGIAGLYLANADGTARLRIVSSVAGASWPAWSPDGQKIVFADGNNTNLDSGKNLWLTDPTGVDLVQLSGFTDTTNGFPHGALWLPDGAGLVAAGKVFTTNGLWIIPLTPDLSECDGPPILLPTTPGDSIDFAGSIVVAPAVTYISPPRLFIREDENSIIIYWSTNVSGFSLQSAQNLPSNPASWTTIPSPYSVNGSFYEHAESKASLLSQKYFRLTYTGPN